MDYGYCQGLSVNMPGSKSQDVFINKDFYESKMSSFGHHQLTKNIFVVSIVIFDCTKLIY